MYKRIMVGSVILLMTFIGISLAGDETDPQTTDVAVRSAYSDWMDKFVDQVTKYPGFIELRVSRNPVKSPQERLTTLWLRLRAWADFAEGSMWQDALTTLREDIAQNVRIEIWSKSPIIDTIVPQDDSIQFPGDEETDPITRPPDDPMGKYDNYIEVEIMYDLK